MALPYPNMDFTALDVLHAADLDKMVANTEYLDNNLNNYTTEQVIGYWGNKSTPLYRKILNFGALPNASEKSVSHGLPSSAVVRNVSAVSFNPTNRYTFILPVLSASSSAFVTIYLTGSEVVINTNSTDRSAFTITTVTIDYTRS